MRKMPLPWHQQRAEGPQRKVPVQGLRVPTLSHGGGETEDHSDEGGSLATSTKGELLSHRLHPHGERL